VGDQAKGGQTPFLAPFLAPVIPAQAGVARAALSRTPLTAAASSIINQLIDLISRGSRARHGGEEKAGTAQG
jgi:hypothetical protein